MTLSDFDKKPLLSGEDVAAALRDNSFETVCEYIAKGPDIRVSELLKGIWGFRHALSREQILEAILAALFPTSGWMRFGTAVVAIRLAKANGLELELQRIVLARWRSFNASDCHELMLGLSGHADVSGWAPILPVFFDLNASTEVRTQILRTVNSIVRSERLPEAKRMLRTLLKRMPNVAANYSRLSDFRFIRELKGRTRFGIFSGLKQIFSLVRRRRASARQSGHSNLGGDAGNS